VQENRADKEEEVPEAAFSESAGGVAV
jgi:hypothetical protein